MQNVGAWRMLGECSTICHLEMWSFGMPFLEHVPCMGMVRKLFTFPSKRVKKAYNQTIAVFCQFVGKQVW